VLEFRGRIAGASRDPIKPILDLGVRRSLMSRAFVNEDAGGDPPPKFDLPDPDSPYYDEAAAWALIQGADQGDSVSAEFATGCRWGEARLKPHVEKILAEAEQAGQDRVAQLARRFLRAVS
jgi:hypothetical protein